MGNGISGVFQCVLTSNTLARLTCGKCLISLEKLRWYATNADTVLHQEPYGLFTVMRAMGSLSACAASLTSPLLKLLVVMIRTAHGPSDCSVPVAQSEIVCCSPPLLDLYGHPDANHIPTTRAPRTSISSSPRIWVTSTVSTTVSTSISEMSSSNSYGCIASKCSRRAFRTCLVVLLDL